MVSWFQEYSRTYLRCWKAGAQPKKMAAILKYAAGSIASWRVMSIWSASEWDLCEADIWWLACCKKRHFPDRKIYYYVPEWEMMADDPKRILMNAYGIVIREIHCPNNDYSEFYEKTLKELSELSEEWQILSMEMFRMWHRVNALKSTFYSEEQNHAMFI